MNTITKKSTTHTKNNMTKSFNKVISKLNEYEKVWASIGVKREKVETEAQRVKREGRYWSCTFNHCLDVIRADGRGHFLSSYDGEENSVTIDGIEYFIYRIN